MPPSAPGVDRPAMPSLDVFTSRLARNDSGLGMASPGADDDLTLRPTSRYRSESASDPLPVEPRETQETREDLLSKHDRIRSQVCEWASLLPVP
jgi:hypothetical protein